MKALKTPSGKWRVVCYSHKDPDGKEHYKTFTKETKAEALRAGAEFMRNKTLSVCNMTLNEATERFLEAKKEVLSPSTYYQYCWMSEKLDFLGPMKVDRITSEDLQRFVSAYSNGRKAKTCRNMYNLILNVLKTYTDKSFKVNFKQSEPLRYNVPTKSDILNLMDAASKDLKVAIALGALYGLRRGEICSLTVDDLDFQKKTIHIHSDMVRTAGGWVVKDIPKTSTSDRIIPVDDELLSMLPEEGRICLYTPSTLSCRFIRLRDSLGLKCRFHDLRHYSASIRAAMGFPTSYNVAFHGWRSDGMLRKVYDNMNEDIRKEYDAQSIALAESFLKKS